MPTTRSAGVTTAAVISILGSVLCLLFALLMLLSALVLRAQPGMPAYPGWAIFMEAALFGALTAWGIATAIGLIRLRGWARVSTIVFGLLLILGCGSGAVALAFFRPAPQPGAPPEVMAGIIIVLACFYACLAVLGGWWLYLFNTLPVRRQFGAEISEPGGRPLSISIIGWFLLIGGLACFAGAFTSFPAMVLGLVLSGWAARAAYLATAAIQAWLGLGLLRLRPLSRVLAIALFVYGSINSLLFALLPDSTARLRGVMTNLPGGLGEATRAARTAAFSSVNPSLMLAALLCLIPVWFLVARRKEFRAH